VALAFKGVVQPTVALGFKVMPVLGCKATPTRAHEWLRLGQHPPHHRLPGPHLRPETPM